MRSMTAKAVVPVALAVTGFVVFCCLLLYSVLKADLVEHAAADAGVVAGTILKSTRYAMLKGDRETLAATIDNIGNQKGIETLRIFDKRGFIAYSRDHSELHRMVDKQEPGCAGCHAKASERSNFQAMGKPRLFVGNSGRRLLGISAPIANDPACSSASCHAHSPKMQLLGILDLGVDQTPFETTLALMRTRMIVFSIMVLILTVGGVAALLRRRIFIPLGQLADYTADRSERRLREMAEQKGELGTIAANHRNLLMELERKQREIEKLKKCLESR